MHTNKHNGEIISKFLMTMFHGAWLIMQWFDLLLMSISLMIFINVYLSLKSQYSVTELQWCTYIGAHVQL